MTTITDELMTSDRTPHRAVRVVAGESVWWVVSWLPDRPLTRNQAVTAMTLAETIHDPWMEPHLANWAAEIGIDVEDAIRRVGA